jgi:hypothetical protein
VFWLTTLLGNMILAGQIVMVDDSSVASQVMYGFDLARNHMWKRHRWKGIIQVSLASIWHKDVDQIRQDLNYEILLARSIRIEFMSQQLLCVLGYVTACFQVFF